MFRCTLALATALLFALPAGAQVQRSFPQNALRGEITVGEPPELTLNGKPTRLAPGARIRSQANMLEMSGSLIGQRLPVHYTIDINGQVKDIWLLTPEELAKRPWPTKPEEAARWEFDAIAQTWTKR